MMRLVCKRKKSFQFSVFQCVDSVLATVFRLYKLSTIFHFLEIGIGMYGIENFVTPHKGNHIRVAEVFDVVGIPYGNVDNFQFFAADIIADDFAGSLVSGIHVAEAYHSFSADDQKLFIFCMMPMIAFGNAWLGNVDRKLSPCG